MAIRNGCKALIIEDGKILLNKAIRSNGTFYYDMPGGGQNPYETLEEAVARECMEETGYTVEVGKLLCVHESICMRDDLRQRLSDHTHVVFFLFECGLTDAPQVEPTEPDSNQDEIVWLPLEELKSADFRPPAIRDYIIEGIDPQTIRHIPALRWPEIKE